MASIPSNSRHAYYNEHDPEKCAWLRELVREGVIADGEIDQRSIKEVEPRDVENFSQCHFFAGIGVWSYALRLAGWPDDRPVWTGSCPCPSFSAAGKGAGFDDPRHLWPDWARLVRVGKPATIFGEQADDAIGYGWLDLVQTDLERENYAVGKAVLGACSVGAPHIRQRLYFVAHSETAEAFARSCEVSQGTRTHHANGFGIGGNASRLEHADSERLGEEGVRARKSRIGGDGPDYGMANTNGRGFAERGIAGTQRDDEQCGADVGMGNSSGTRLQERERDGRIQRFALESQSREATERGSYVNGWWKNADWILRKRWNSENWEWCPTEPGTFPLASGASHRVLKLRGYGDAIVPQVAAAFIQAFVESVQHTESQTAKCRA